MTPTTELPDEIYLEPKPATWGAMLFSVTDPKNGRAVAYTRKDKADAEIARLRAAVRDLRHGAFGDALEKHADTIRECME